MLPLFLNNGLPEPRPGSYNLSLSKRMEPSERGGGGRGRGRRREREIKSPPSASLIESPANTLPALSSPVLFALVV